MQNMIRVHIHRQAEKECQACGFEPESLGVIFADSWKRLRETPGTKLRRLTSTPGYDFRLRVGSHRAVASLASDATGVLSAYIHEVGPRCEVYERDKFGTRLKTFWGGSGGHLHRPYQDTVTSNYRVLDLTLASPSHVPHASLHFLLQLQQQQFFDDVLPLLTHTKSNDAELVIGHGPPGSGKTLVACDLALEAFLDGHDVDVMVPSIGLENEYRRLLKSWDALTQSAQPNGGGVHLWRVSEYFANVAGIRTPFDRESRLRAWWHETLREPAIKSRINQVLGKNGITDRDVAERTPVLIDALLEDDSLWSDSAIFTRAKDRMTSVFESFHGLLAACREPLLDRLDTGAQDGESSLVTRARLACSPIVNNPVVWTGPDGSIRPRLTIVDEAQDLAPSEWRRLLDLWFAAGSRPGPGCGRLVLLGDLDQRVSLVPFHWDDIKQYAIGRLQLPKERIIERQVDSASYRMRRNIARFAGAVFDKEISPHAKVRHQGRIDFDKLLEGGEVHVAVVDRETISVDEILSAGSQSSIAGEYYFVIHGVGANAQKSPDRDDVFLFSVRTAKGLEAERVVVIHPFSRRVGHKPIPVTADEATEYYTAVSRSRQHVLLVIDEPSATILEAAAGPWNLAKIHRIGHDREQLRALVDDCRITLSVDEVRNELVRQLNQVTLQPGDLGVAARERIASLLTRIARTPDEGVVFDLIQAGQQLASSDVVLFASVREGARRAVATQHYDDAVATLLFAGEIVLALRVAKSAPPDRIRAWNVDWLEMAAEESCWQGWRVGQKFDASDLIWTPQLLESVIYDGALARIRSMVSTLSGKAGL